MSEESSGAQLDRDRLRILVVGAGGQGVLTAARILGDAASRSGLEAVLGQLHGMSQRGGSVESTVLIGPGRSSFIEDRGADAVLGLEPLEVLRARRKMSERTKVVTNLGRVVPYTLGLKGQGYPDLQQILAGIRAVTPEVVEVDGPAIVEAAGGSRCLNIAMVGALAGLDVLPFDDKALWSSVEARCPARYLATNQRAFELGRQAVCA